MSKKPVAQTARELYHLVYNCIKDGGVKLSNIPSHIITMVNGHVNYPEHKNIWKVRQFNDKTIELERFEDYLLKPAREGLAIPSLYWLRQVLDAHADNDERKRAYDALLQEIPDFMEKADKIKRKLEVDRVEPVSYHGAPKGVMNNPHGLGGKSDKKADIDKVYNINFIKTENSEPQSTQKSKGGTRAEYLTAKLKRDAKNNPKAAKLLESVADGLITPHAAAVEMGYKKKPDPLSQVQKVLPNLKPKERVELWQELGRSLPDDLDYVQSAKDAVMNLADTELEAFNQWYTGFYKS